jgi:hypothetical protein
LAKPIGVVQFGLPPETKKHDRSSKVNRADRTVRHSRSDLMNGNATLIGDGYGLATILERRR